jgi:hypothetical protein
MPYTTSGQRCQPPSSLFFFPPPLSLTISKVYMRGENAQVASPFLVIKSRQRRFRRRANLHSVNFNISFDEALFGNLDHQQQQQ